MKDRLTLLGASALLVAVVATGWQLSTRAPTTPTAPPDATSSTTAEATPRIGSDAETVVVHLDGLPGAGAFAKPGDHVVLYAFFAAELNAGSAQTRLLLPDVSVVASGPGDAGDTSISVAVSTADAVFLRTVQSLGARTFALLRPVATTLAADPLDGFSDADVRQRLQSAS